MFISSVSVGFNRHLSTFIDFNFDNNTDMKKTRFIIAAIAGLLLFVACERSDFEPFAGKDNFIVSFTLRLGETTLDASVEESVVRVSAPEGLSLEGAKAEIHLSEHASIKPDPSKITAWNEDQQFVVASFAGKQRSYVYTVSRTHIETEGTVILATQADVDAFGQLGSSAVTGNLIIGRLKGTDSIASLLPLASLREVGYVLTINPTYKGADLVGLENMQRIGGVLQIGACPHLETVALPSLERVGGISVENTSTVVVDLPALTRAEGAMRLSCPLYQMNLTALKEARDLTFTSASGARAILAEVSLPALETAGNISVSAMENVSKVNLPKLRTVGNFSLNNLLTASFVYVPLLETAGSISFSNMPVLMEISFLSLVKAQNLTLNQPVLQLAEFPKLAEVAVLTLTDTPIGCFASFPALKTADKVAFFYGNSIVDVETLTVPASIERIGELSVETHQEEIREIDVRGGKVGTLRLLRNSSRSKIKGDEVFNGTLVVNTERAATSPYPDFPQLEGFAEVDSLSVTGLFSSLHLNGIRKLNKSLSLGGGFTLPAVSLPDLEEIGGTLKLFPFYNFTLEAVSAPKLKRVGGDFIANGPGSLIRRVDFPALETVGGNCSINTGMSLYDRQIEALLFPKLTSVGGTLTIRNESSYPNTAMKNFDGFAALRTVKAISVTGQMGVESFDGLKPAVRNLRPEDWSASGNAINPSYEDMIR
jgi:hypothetical protein